MNNKVSLKNLINYCFGYIKLVNPSFNRFRIYTEPIDDKYLSTSIIGDPNFVEDSILPLEFEDFYEKDQSTELLDSEIENEYLKQKELVLKINEIKDTENLTLRMRLLKEMIMEC